MKKKKKEKNEYLLSIGIKQRYMYIRLNQIIQR